MVYESDFYTVRRPYSRPTITSYSVTAPRIGISTWKVKPSIRSSILIGELDRIYHRPRPHLGYAPLEDYLNSRPLVDFDDETKLIRAETDKLMRRIYTSVPHPRTSCPFQLITYNGGYTPKKPTSTYHNHHSMVDDILSMSYYSEPSARTIGRGHLACVSYAGGRGYPRRKHLFSDEYRDIGDEIKTRSYYNNNYNRAYVDAMSLPTGFASYLLRIKPPEKNGTLTNVEKMHIIALSEERKKNAKINERVDGILENLHKTSDASLKQTTKTPKSNKVTKSKDYHINEETKPEYKKESSISEVVPLLKSESLSEETPLATKYDIEKADPVLQTEKLVEYPSEEKINKKKSSISEIPSYPEPSPLLAEDIKPQSEDEITSTEIITSKEENLHDAITEPQDSEEVDQINNKIPECEPAEEDNIITSEPIKVEPEIENQTIPLEETVDSAPSEIRPSHLDESNTIADTVSSQEVVIETSPDENVPLDSKDEEKDSKDDNIDNAASFNSNRLEESEEQGLPSSENEQMSEAAFDAEKIIIEPQLNQQENIDAIAESNVENADLTETNQTPIQEKEPTDEIIENISSKDIPEAQEQPTQMDTTSIHSVQDSNSDINEPVKLLDEMVSEDSKEKEIQPKEEENANELSSDIHSIIEEVTGMGNSETTKESEAEPLIEEPQSPEITEVESEKITSNIISEVLSDVAEES